MLYVCEHCSKNFDNKSNLNRHLNLDRCKFLRMNKQDGPNKSQKFEDSRLTGIEVTIKAELKTAVSTLKKVAKFNDAQILTQMKESGFAELESVTALGTNTDLWNQLMERANRECSSLMKLHGDKNTEINSKLAAFNLVDEHKALRRRTTTLNHDQLITEIAFTETYLQYLNMLKDFVVNEDVSRQRLLGDLIGNHLEILLSSKTKTDFEETQPEV